MAGMQVGYHNHWWEFDTCVDGIPAWRHMLDTARRTASFSRLTPIGRGLAARTSWSVLNTLGSRVAQVLHIKDGPADDPQADMMAVGSGVMDWPPILAASNVDWLVVEIDRCGTDMLQAVRDSATWLTGKGFARGQG